MMNLIRFLMITIFMLHRGVLPGAAEEKPYIVLDENLQQLKDDFNAKVGTVRLLFIIGPTCGICLRGMADLNDEFLADYQNDPRLNTYAVHVPVMKAEEKHLVDSLPLMQGPRINHYWDPVGTIGKLYSSVLDTKVFAWDVWFVYGPEAKWEGENPPKPDYWEHQLKVAFGRENYLDKKRFAAEVIKRVNELDIDDANKTEVASTENPQKDGVVISWVGQGFGRAIKDYIDSQHGIEAIMAIQSRELRGKLIIGNQEFGLVINETRPNLIEKQVPDIGFAMRYDGKMTVEQHGELPVEGIPQDAHGHLLGYFDFDTPLIDWDKKGYTFSMDGAEKRGESFSWRLVQTDSEGQKWTYLINTRTGLIERMQAYNEDGALLITVLYSDFRDVDGVPIAHQRKYVSPKGETYAIEQFNSIQMAYKDQSNQE